MPRLPPALFWRARCVAPAAALLLPVCRDLPSAFTELRWIREAVEAAAATATTTTAATTATTVGRAGRNHAAIESRVRALCRRRGRGEPLQYVLGTQPFGPLELLCRRGVLIPRPEPEAYSVYLADWLLREARERQERQERQQKQDQQEPQEPQEPQERPPHSPAPLTILDACTGTGCIALLLYARLRPMLDAVQVVGLDVAPAAVHLAQTNAVRNGLVSAEGAGADSVADNAPAGVSFVEGDLFADGWLAHPTVQQLTAAPLDVLVSNPPYVSAAGFAHETARSVRLFEPKCAQVPADHEYGTDAAADAPEDVFYVRLLALAARLDARIVLCEVGGRAQATRVAALAARAEPRPCAIEIWADNPDVVDSTDDKPPPVVVDGRLVPVHGSGHCRSVFVRRR